MEPIVIEQSIRKANIKLYRGDDFTIRLRYYTDATKTALQDLTGADGRLAIVDKQGTVIDALSVANGRIELLNGSVMDVTDFNWLIHFPKAVTAGYTWKSGSYDYEHTDSLGVTRTLMGGTVTVTPDKTV